MGFNYYWESFPSSYFFNFFFHHFVSSRLWFIEGLKDGYEQEEGRVHVLLTNTSFSKVDSEVGYRSIVHESFVVDTRSVTPTSSNVPLQRRGELQMSIPYPFSCLFMYFSVVSHREFHVGGPVVAVVVSLLFWGGVWMTQSLSRR